MVSKPLLCPVFTKEEADRRLPYIKKIVADAVRDFGRLKTIGEDLRSRQRRGLPAEDEKNAGARLKEVIKGYVTEIANLGAVVRDVELGIVDFTTVIDGQMAYLSWKLGEEAVTHWHGAEEGFEDRRPL